MIYIIPLVINDCSECPFVVNKRTPGAGYAQDYFCGKMENRKIMGYVEWQRDIKDISEWCPYRELNEEIKRRQNTTSQADE